MRSQPHETTLEPGDYVVFCSDGIIETANTDEGIFGFEQTAVATIKKACAEALIDRLIGVAQDSAGDEPQGDDMTCVVLRVLYRHKTDGQITTRWRYVLIHLTQRLRSVFSVCSLKRSTELCFVTLLANLGQSSLWTCDGLPLFFCFLYRL